MPFRNASSCDLVPSDGVLLGPYIFYMKTLAQALFVFKAIESTLFFFFMDGHFKEGPVIIDLWGKAFVP